MIHMSTGQALIIERRDPTGLAVVQSVLKNTGEIKVNNLQRMTGCGLNRPNIFL